MTVKVENVHRLEILIFKTIHQRVNSGWSKKLPGEPAWGVFFQCIEDRSRIRPRVQEARVFRATDHEEQMKPLAGVTLNGGTPPVAPGTPRRILMRGFSWSRNTPPFLESWSSSHGMERIAGLSARIVVTAPPFFGPERS